MFHWVLRCLAALLMALVGFLPSVAQTPAKPMPATSRLAAAKTAFVKRVEGSKVAFNTVYATLEGWGRFVLVDAPEKADLVIEVYAPEDSGTSVTTSTRASSSSDHPESTTTTSRQVGGGPVKLLVLDRQAKLPLWSASEKPRFALRQKGRDDALVEAAQNLVSQFRARVEPQ